MSSWTFGSPRTSFSVVGPVHAREGSRVATLTFSDLSALQPQPRFTRGTPHRGRATMR
jgi:hypothetical protein